MSKKMKIPSIFKTTLEAKQPWQWPSCKNPKTLSFCASNDVVFKTVNSVFLELSDGLETPESWFTNSSECASFSTDEISDGNNNNNGNNNTSTDALETIIREVKSSERLFFKPGDTSSISEDNTTTSVDAVEMIIQGVKSSERLFFEPGYTSSILKETKTTNDDLPFKESVALALESDDPYLDFKKSMQEMVESHGLKEWDCLEELLGWYLKMNGKMNHGFIVGAFVELLIGLASNNSATPDSLAKSSARVCCSDSTPYSSADSSFSSSPPSSPLSPALVVVGHEIATGDERDVIVQRP